MALYNRLQRFTERSIHFARHQFWNLRRALKGKSLTTPSFTAATTEQEDVQCAREWLERPDDWYDQSVVEEFESVFADWNESKTAKSFMGGRVALSAIIEALGLGSGDEVVVPGYTCVVVPNSFQYAGVDVRYADVELETFGPDVEDFESKITDKTKAIFIHHLFGLVCRDYELLLDVAEKNGLYVIEDCTHATGAKYRGKKVGNFGDAAIYSSEHSKCFSTVQGGIATTNDSEIAKGLDEYASEAVFPRGRRVKRLLHNFLLDYYTKSHPQRWWWGDLYRFRYGNEKLSSTTEMEKRGEQPPHYGQRMPAPLAAIGLRQIDKLESYNERRRHTAKFWKEWTEKNGYNTPQVIPGSQPVWLRYPVLVEPKKKEDTSWVRRELGIHAGVWFQTNIHPVDQTVEECPNADEAVNRCINLPTLLE